MNDKVEEALAIIRAEFGFKVMTLWAPGSQDADVEALLFAKDDKRPYGRSSQLRDGRQDRVIARRHNGWTY